MAIVQARGLVSVCLAIAAVACGGDVVDGPARPRDTSITQDNATAGDGSDAPVRDGRGESSYDDDANGGGAYGGGAYGGGAGGGAADGGYAGGSFDVDASVGPGEPSMDGGRSSEPDAGAVVTPEPTPDPEAELKASIERGGATYAALCAGCHGANGKGEGFSVRKYDSFDTLSNVIDKTMPKGSPSSCVDRCADDVANYILATF